MHKFIFLYGDRAKLCYMDTDSFIILILTEEFYKDIANDNEKWSDTYNYDENDKKSHRLGKTKKWLVCLKKN